MEAKQAGVQTVKWHGTAARHETAARHGTAARYGFAAWHEIAARIGIAGLAALLGLIAPGCGADKPSPPKGGAAVATLEVVRPEVSISHKGRNRQATWSARVAAGDHVVSGSGRAWLRHDAGARVLLDAGAEILVMPTGVSLLRGRVWVEAPTGRPSLVRVAQAQISAAGAGFELIRPKTGTPRVVVARGRVEVRIGDQMTGVAAGEQMHLALTTGATAAHRKPTLRAEPVVLWDDWTGGLAWPSAGGADLPAGMGEIGARRPGRLGRASFPLAVRSLDVKTRIHEDLATTLVDQVFFNPASEDLEGVYRVRLPRGAMLQAFCIDRPSAPGRLVCGYVRERQQARAEYRARVYAGSREDPALLEWEAPGRYKAHLYPLKAGASRRVVILYTEWLERQDDVRRWRYPMGVPGGAGPMIQEFRLEVDLTDSGARRLEAGLGAAVQGRGVVLQRSDFRPRSDFVLTLHGGGQSGVARTYVSKKREKEGRYVMVRLRPPELARSGAREPLALAIVVDTSADTDPSELQLARAFVAALLGHLGADDRVTVLGADLDLDAPGKKRPTLSPVTPATREAVLERLSHRRVGGATDLGRVLTAAAGILPAGRGGAVIYVGDGVPTVGEMTAKTLSRRLARLARPVRVYGVAVGPEADLGLLAALASTHGGRAERVTARAEAALAALHIAAHASRPVLHRVKVSLGPRAERVFPVRPVTAVAGRDLVVLGRLRGESPKAVEVSYVYHGQTVRHRWALAPRRIADGGDLRLRWATARLRELLATGAGREEVAELGTRFGLITAHTSIYVPSGKETVDSSEAQKAMKRVTLRVQQEIRLQDQRARERRNTERKETMGWAQKKRPRKAEKAANQPAGVLPADEETERDARDSKTFTESTAEKTKDESLRAPASMDAPASTGSPKPPASAPMVLRGPSAGATRALGKASARFKGKRRPKGRRPRRRHHANALAAGDDIGVGGGGGGVGLGGAGFGQGRARPGRGEGRRGYAGGSRLMAPLRTARKDKQRDATLQAYRHARMAARRRGLIGGNLQVDGRIDVYLHRAGKKHRPKRCSPASLQPLASRRTLWRERLAARGTPAGAKEVWLDALRHCELPRWQDRRVLVFEIVRRLGRVRSLVSFARRARPTLGWGAWAVLKRAVYARIRSAADMRIAGRLFHPGRGLAWAEVEQLLAKLKTDDDRLRELLALRADHPREVRLALRVLWLLEKTGRHAGAERIAAEVEGNPYADARLRTAVGEYWARRNKPARARRVFSEIVEFRPRDPLARRRLGDLYRAFGWYEEAYRQYQTLATLEPQDSSVLLLMALAAAGAGRVDEALRLEQRVAASAAGSGGAARWALLWSSLRLALLRDAARAKGKTLELAKLVSRTRRSGVLRHARPLRVLLTWSHPEADLELWGAHPGWRAQRANELGPQFGIEAFSVRQVRPGSYTFEVRRVGRHRTRSLKATLYVLWDEGKPNERLARFPVTLSPDTDRVRIRVAGRKAEVIQ